jgi:hypothetical protein
MYDILSLTNLTLLATDMILLCIKKKKTYLIHDSLSIEKYVFSFRFGATDLPSDKYVTMKLTVHRLKNYTNVAVTAGLPVINSFGVCLRCDVVTW